MRTPALALITTLANAALAQNPSDPEEGPKYRVCPTEEYPLPFCCTNVFAGMGLGCKTLVGGEEYDSLRDFQNECYQSYAERDAACCGDGGFLSTHLCITPTEPVKSPTPSAPEPSGTPTRSAGPDHEKPPSEAT